MTKIKLVKKLTKRFDKSHHFYTLHIFVYYFGVPWLRFKHAEVWRFFNLTIKIFTKNHRLQEWSHDKQILPYPNFSSFHPTSPSSKYQMEIFILLFFPILKSFITNTIFQAKLPSHCVIESHTVRLWIYNL